MKNSKYKYNKYLAKIKRVKIVLLHGGTYERIKNDPTWLYSDEGQEWFNSDEGQEWFNLDEGQEWFNTEEVQEEFNSEESWFIWFNSPNGQNWFNSENGHAWFSGIYGDYWLSNRGVGWLNTPEGVAWLNNPSGRVWFNSPPGQQRYGTGFDNSTITINLTDDDDVGAIYNKLISKFTDTPLKLYIETPIGFKQGEAYGFGVDRDIYNKILNHFFSDINIKLYNQNIFSDPEKIPEAEIYLSWLNPQTYMICGGDDDTEAPCTETLKLGYIMGYICHLVKMNSWEFGADLNISKFILSLLKNEILEKEDPGKKFLNNYNCDVRRFIDETHILIEYDKINNINFPIISTIISAISVWCAEKSQNSILELDQFMVNRVCSQKNLMLITKIKNLMLGENCGWAWTGVKKIDDSRFQREKIKFNDIIWFLADLMEYTLKKTHSKIITEFQDYTRENEIEDIKEFIKPITSDNLSIDELRNEIYEKIKTSDHAENFKKVLGKMDKNKIRELLKFWAGTPKFNEEWNYKLIIGKENLLPVAQTCFFQLSIPPPRIIVNEKKSESDDSYVNYLYSSILKSIELTGETFGME